MSQKRKDIGRKNDINEGFKKTLFEKYNLNNNFRDCRSFFSHFFLISNETKQMKF